MRGRLLTAVAIAAIALLPAACGSGDGAEGEAEQNLAGDPEAPEGITVSDGRLVMPPVSGNPAAVYFTIANASDEELVLRAASVEGAGSAMMHSTMDFSGHSAMRHAAQQAVPAGESVAFEPGGLHLMVFELSDALTAGEQTEVTLTFESGDKVSFPAEIRAAGDAR